MRHHYQDIFDVVFNLLIGVFNMIYNVLFNGSDREEDIELPDDIRAGTDISLSVDGVVSEYHVMTVGGPIIGGVACPANIRVVKR